MTTFGSVLALTAVGGFGSVINHVVVNGFVWPKGSCTEEHTKFSSSYNTARIDDCSMINCRRPLPRQRQNVSTGISGSTNHHGEEQASVTQNPGRSNTSATYDSTDLGHSSRQTLDSEIQQTPLNQKATSDTDLADYWRSWLPGLRLSTAIYKTWDRSAAHTSAMSRKDSAITRGMATEDDQTRAQMDVARMRAARRGKRKTNAVTICSASPSPTTETSSQAHSQAHTSTEVRGSMIDRSRGYVPFTRRAIATHRESYGQQSIHSPSKSTVGGNSLEEIDSIYTRFSKTMRSSFGSNRSAGQPSSQLPSTRCFWSGGQENMPATINSHHGFVTQQASIKSPKSHVVKRTYRCHHQATSRSIAPQRSKPSAITEESEGIEGIVQSTASATSQALSLQQFSRIKSKERQNTISHMIKEAELASSRYTALSQRKQQWLQKHPESQNSETETIIDRDIASVIGVPSLELSAQIAAFRRFELAQERSARPFVCCTCSIDHGSKCPSSSKYGTSGQAAYSIMLHPRFLFET